MTTITDQILIFYAFGLIMFIIAIETEKVPKNFIYMGLSFFVNLIGYYVSYNDTDFVKTAYFSLVLVLLSVIFLIYKGFESLKLTFSTDECNYQDY